MKQRYLWIMDGPYKDHETLEVRICVKDVDDPLLLAKARRSIKLRNRVAERLRKFSAGGNPVRRRLIWARKLTTVPKENLNLNHRGAE
jgi:hypothetical protein